MEAAKFTEILGADFYTGVPDSQLKALCNYLMKTYGPNESRLCGKCSWRQENDIDCSLLAERQYRRHLPRRTVGSLGGKRLQDYR